MSDNEKNIKAAEDLLNTEDPQLVDKVKVDEALARVTNTGELTTVNMACRRDQHLNGRPGASSGDDDLRKARCNSTSAYVMNKVMPGLKAGHSIYRCVKCDYSWSVALGGNFSY